MLGGWRRWHIRVIVESLLQCMELAKSVLKECVEVVGLWG